MRPICRGRYFWNKRTEDGLRKAIECFNEGDRGRSDLRAALRGPCRFLCACREIGSMACCSPKDAFPKARAAADRALALDDSLGEAHASLAFALRPLLLGLERGRGRAQASDRAEPELCDGASLVRLASDRHGTKSRGTRRIAKGREPRSALAHHRRRFGRRALHRPSRRGERPAKPDDPGDGSEFCARPLPSSARPSRKERCTTRRSPSFGPPSRSPEIGPLRLEPRLRARHVRTQG